MTVKLLTEHFLENLATQARMSLHLSKCKIVGNHMSRLNYMYISLQVTEDPGTQKKRQSIKHTSLNS